MKILPRYSMGIGDRFAMEGFHQIRAFLSASEKGVIVMPVWNKSNREHTIVGTLPESVREEADTAVIKSGWKNGHAVDADHIGTGNVDRFLSSSDFFTIDVADFIGRPGSSPDPETTAHIRRFLKSHPELNGNIEISGMEESFCADSLSTEDIAWKYIPAVREAGRIYRHIAAAKPDGNFAVEVSMDETDEPQTAFTLLCILAAISDEQIPVQTIAPRFSGKFLKGVEYVGNPDEFAREFEQDLLVTAHAVKKYHLPSNLKLSVHSGSDKFSLYPLIHTLLKHHNAGVHLKTAGTTWLAEIAAIAAAGGEALETAREIYRQAYQRIDEMCAPYAAVIEIDRTNLPSPSDVSQWDGGRYAAALVHDAGSPEYNRDFRQLLHVSFKAAAEMQDRFKSAVNQNSTIVGKFVTENIYSRHIEPLFIGRHQAS